MRFGKSFLTVALLGTAMAACAAKSGGESDLNGDGVEDSLNATVRGVDTVTLEAPSSPVGSVWGVLLNGYTGEPVANKEVTIVTSKNHQLKATTDAFGGFMVNAVSPGTFRLVVEGGADFMNLRAAGELYVNGVTDNASYYMGRVYMFPKDSTYTVSLLTDDGHPLANVNVVVNLTTGAIEPRTNVDVTPQTAAEADYVTLTLTTNAQGAITIPEVPTAAKLVYVSRAPSFKMFELVAPAYDRTGDGVADYDGLITTATYERMVALGNTIVTRSRALDDQAFRCATNLVERNATRRPVALLPAAGPFTLVCNQPVDLASVSISVINSFSQGGLNNSRPQQPGERAAVDAINANTKPNSGMPTMTATTDASRTIVYLTPNQALPAGAEVRFVGSLASARASDAGQARTFHLAAADFGAYIAPSAPALSVASAYVERNGAATGYNTITLMTSRAISAYSNGQGYVFVCSKDDLNNNGRHTFADTGVLEPGECPDDPTTFNFTDADRLSLIKAMVRDNVTPLRNATSQFFTFSATSPNADPIFTLNRSAVKLSLIVPLVNGAVYEDEAQLSFPDGQPVGFGFVSDIDVSLVSGAANVVTDLDTTQKIFLP